MALHDIADRIYNLIHLTNLHQFCYVYIGLGRTLRDLSLQKCNKGPLLLLSPAWENRRHCDVTNGFPMKWRLKNESRELYKEGTERGPRDAAYVSLSLGKS